MPRISCHLPGDTKRSGEPRNAICHEVTVRVLYKELYEMQVFKDTLTLPAPSPPLRAGEGEP